MICNWIWPLSPSHHLQKSRNGHQSPNLLMPISFNGKLLLWRCIGPQPPGCSLSTQTHASLEISSNLGAICQDVEVAYTCRERVALGLLPLSLFGGRRVYSGEEWGYFLLLMTDSSCPSSCIVCSLHKWIIKECLFFAFGWFLFFVCLFGIGLTL